MLAGFFFLGILAATSIPDVMDLLRSGDDQAQDDETQTEEDLGNQEVEQEPAPLPDPAEEEAPEPEPFDPADGEDLFVDPAPGETEVQSFNPGIDSLTIVLPEEAQEFAAHDADGDQHAYLSYEIAEGTVQITFPGLSGVPVDDIFLRVSDVSSPTLDADIALSQLMDDGDPDSAGAVLTPTDPTLPEAPANPVDPGGPVLTPVDPELPDDPAPPTDGDGPVLQPVDDSFEVADDAATLATLIQRDGGSAVGLVADGGAVSMLGPEDDTLALPDGPGGPGALGVGQAAANLIGTNGAVATVDLGAGDDAFTGGNDAAYGFGGAGNDTLAAGPGVAALFGGADADLLLGDPEGGQSLLHGGAGNDTLIGGSAGAWLDGGEHGEVSGDAGNDSITGGAGDDTIRGGWGADSLAGGAGNDVIDHRGTDSERIIAERHEFAWHIDGAPDSLDGGAGDDTLTFDRGDVVTGGAGDWGRG